MRLPAAPKTSKVSPMTERQGMIRQEENARYTLLVAGLVE